MLVAIKGTAITEPVSGVVIVPSYDGLVYGIKLPLMQALDSRVDQACTRMQVDNHQGAEPLKESNMQVQWSYRCKGAVLAAPLVVPMYSRANPGVGDTDNVLNDSGNPKRLKTQHDQTLSNSTCVVVCDLRGWVHALTLPRESSAHTEALCRWTLDLGAPIFASPVECDLHASRMIVATVAGTIFCIAIADGHVLWQMPVSTWSEMPSSAASATELPASLQNRAIYAPPSVFHVLDQPSVGSAFIARATLAFIGCHDGHLYCLNAATGQLLASLHVQQAISRSALGALNHPEAPNEQSRPALASALSFDPLNGLLVESPAAGVHDVVTLVARMSPNHMGYILPATATDQASTSRSTGTTAVCALQNGSLVVVEVAVKARAAEGLNTSLALADSHSITVELRVRRHIQANGDVFSAPAVMQNTVVSGSRADVVFRAQLPDLDVSSSS